MLRLIAISAVVLGITTAHAEARPQTQPALVLGFGQDSCGQYLQASIDEARARPSRPRPNATYTTAYRSYLDWLDGFLSGTNFTDPEDRQAGEQTDAASRMQWLDNFCREHPLWGFAAAAIHLRGELAARNPGVPR